MLVSNLPLVSRRGGRYTLLMEPAFDQMTTAERILYVQELWDRIAADAGDVPLSEAQRVELQRRFADHETHPEKAVPWEVAREQVRQRR
jgi:putative addiction module component (TIGR02574 family)